MFRHLILGCCAIASNALAQESPVQIYGRLNLGIEHLSGDAEGTRLSNNRSVLGFRGSEALGGGTKLIYQIEGTLSPDTGAGSIAARDTRLGLEGAYGTLFAGNWTTPYNSATASLDPFYPTTAGYMSIMGNGAAATVSNTSDTASFDRRQQNSLHYWTPNWRGLSLRVAQGISEERPANGAHPSLTSLAAIYEQGDWYAALAHERHHEYQGPGLNDSGSKAAAAYSFGATRLAAIAEKLRYETASGKLERPAWYVSATHTFGANVLRFGVAKAGKTSGNSTQQIGVIKAGPDTGAWHATIGYDYNLSRRTSVFVYYTRLDNQKNGVADFAINNVSPSPGATLGATVLGMRHAF